MRHKITRRNFGKQYQFHMSAMILHQDENHSGRTCRLEIFQRVRARWGKSWSKGVEGSPLEAGYQNESYLKDSVFESCSMGQPHVAEDDLECWIHRPLHLQCQDYRQASTTCLVLYSGGDGPQGFGCTWPVCANRVLSPFPYRCC